MEECSSAASLNSPLPSPTISQWTGCHVVFHIDNNVIVDTLATNCNHSWHTMLLLHASIAFSRWNGSHLQRILTSQLAVMEWVASLRSRGLQPKTIGNPVSAPSTWTATCHSLLVSPQLYNGCSEVSRGSMASATATPRCLSHLTSCVACVPDLPSPHSSKITL